MREARRPLRWSVRAVIAAGLLAGLNFVVITPSLQPEQIGLATKVYSVAADAALAGENFYAVESVDENAFLYPPIVVLAFVPHALVGGGLAALALQGLVNVVAALGLAVVVLRALARRGRRLPRLDRWLVVTFVVASLYGVNQIVMGQVNIVLGLSLAAGYELLDRRLFADAPAVGAVGSDGYIGGATPDSDGGRQENVVGSRLETFAGALLAVPAVLKVFPATVGLFLLRVRAWRAVAAAIATGVGALVLGAAVLGFDMTEIYLLEVLPGRFEGQTFDGTPRPGANHTTVHRQLAALLGADSPLITPLAVGILGAVVLATYRRIDTDERRLAAFLATIVGTLLALPLQPLYYPLFLFPLFVLLVQLPSGRARTALLVGTLCTLLVVDFEAIVAVLAALPAGLGDPLIAAVEATFTFVLPPTVGMWLLLVGCLLVQYGPAGDDVARSFESEPRTVGDDDASATAAPTRP